MYSDYDLDSDYYSDWDELTDFYLEGDDTPISDAVLDLFEDDTPLEWGDEDYRSMDIRR